MKYERLPKKKLKLMCEDCRRWTEHKIIKCPEDVIFISTATYVKCEYCGAESIMLPEE